MQRPVQCPPGFIQTFVHYKGITVIEDTRNEFKGIPLYRPGTPNKRHLVAIFHYEVPTARGLSEPKPLTCLHDIHSVTHALARPQPDLLKRLFTMAQADLLYTQTHFPGVINGRLHQLPWYPKRPEILFS